MLIRVSALLFTFRSFLCESLREEGSLQPFICTPSIHSHSPDFSFNLHFSKALSDSRLQVEECTQQFVIPLQISNHIQTIHKLTSTKMCKYTFHQSSTCHEHQEPNSHSHTRSHHRSHHHHSHPSSPKFKDKNVPRQPCQWIQIAQPCNWGMGLLTCPIFASSSLRIEGPMIVRVVKNMCPAHDFRGVYDRNLVKMVEERKTGGSVSLFGLWVGEAREGARRLG